MLVLRPRLMSSSWTQRSRPWVSLHRRHDLKAANLAVSPPELGSPPLSENPTVVPAASKPPAELPRPRRKPLPRAEDEWFCVRNLSDALYRLEKALHTEDAP